MERQGWEREWEKMFLGLGRAANERAKQRRDREGVMAGERVPRVGICPELWDTIAVVGKHESYEWIGQLRMLSVVSTCCHKAN